MGTFIDFHHRGLRLKHVSQIEESPEPAGRSEVPDAGERAAAVSLYQPHFRGRQVRKASPAHPDQISQERQEKFVGDEVWLKGTPQGTIRLQVVNQKLKDRKWWLQLQLPEENEPYNNGAWFSQKKVKMAKKGPKHDP